MKKTLLASSLLLANSLTAAMAEEQELGLSGSGEAGYSQTTGNTETESIYGALKLNYLQKAYELKGLVEGSNKSEDGNKTQERYLGDLQANLFIPSHPKAYGFGQFRAEQDRFASIDLSTYYLAGLGYNFYKQKNLVLQAELGAGYQNIEYTSESGEDDTSQTIGKFYGNFEYGLNERVRFLQDLSIFSGGEQTLYETHTGFKVNLNGSLNLRLAYKYRYNDTPAEGKKKEDTETVLTLLYDF
jgi:putative salt-induced outer membrane protein